MIKCIVALCTCCITNLAVFAQDAFVDSLQQSVKTARNDSAKTEAILALGDYYYLNSRLNDDAVVVLLRQAIDLSEKHGRYQQQAGALLRLGKLLFKGNFGHRDAAKARAATEEALSISRRQHLFSLEPDILLSLSNQVADNSDSARLLIAQAFGVAAQHGLAEAMVNVLRAKARTFGNENPDSTRRYLDAAIMQSIAAATPEAEVYALTDLAKFFSGRGKADSAIYSMQHALQVARKYGLVGSQRTILLTLMSSERGYFVKDSLLPYYLESLALARNFGRDSLVPMSVYAQSSQDIGNSSTALSTYLDLLHVNQVLKDSAEIANALYGVALAYQNTKDYDQSVSYLRQTFTYGNSNPFINMFAHVDMAKDFLYLKKPDSARNYAEAAYRLAVDFYGSEPAVYGGVLDDLGNVYFSLNNDSLALNYLRRAFYDFTHTNVEFLNYAATTMGLANYFSKAGITDSSVYYARLCLQTAADKGFLTYVTESATLLAAYYKGRKQPDSAFLYQQMGYEAYRKLYNDESAREFQNMSFGEQQREQAIAIAKKDAVYQIRYRLRVYGLLTGLLVAILIVAIIYRNSRQQRRSFELLKKQKQEIDVQKAKLESSLSELQLTQSQLIQSEKMASLGELTAGIAHEIQNPLNFVNNFSEVNMELVDELQAELKQGNTDAALPIANDIKENEIKINHHGKRADGIVKGMLQHSRTSNTDTAVPADINKMADEYLRLSYHGLRAKDKQFNAGIKSDLDDTIGEIMIVPQDLGRVLLNLYNNAFYAVSEKAKQHPKDFHPLVEVSTRKLDQTVEIRVKDNGNGIPRKVLDKIFQPFFTTKPTGLGTGLGLSLSYDIIRAHRGDIRVETIEGTGSEFIIKLPLS